MTFLKRLVIESLVCGIWFLFNFWRTDVFDSNINRLIIVSRLAFQLPRISLAFTGINLAEIVGAFPAFSLSPFSFPSLLQDRRCSMWNTFQLLAAVQLSASVNIIPKKRRLYNTAYH